MSPKMKKSLAAMAVLIIAGLLAYGLNVLKPKVKKGRTKPSVPVVSTIALSPGTHSIQIEANGTVIPVRKIELLAEVEGMAVYVNPELGPGGLIKKGDVLLRIDATDYDLEIRNKKALVAEARLNLELERAQQNIARMQWKPDGKIESQGQVNMSLALRVPQLEAALAKLDAAQSALEAAELARKRTVVRNPFNALVLGQNISKGQLVTRQRPVATLVDTDEFFVQVSVSLDKLRWIRFPSKKENAATRAEVAIDLGSGDEVVRKAKAYKLHGDLDPKGRMAKVLFSLRDPLNLNRSNNGNGDYEKFLLGSFVAVRIDAGRIVGAFSIPRAAMRDNGTVWILGSGNTLDIREVEVAWLRKDDILVTGGLSAGERLITSPLQSPLPGMALMAEGQVAQKPSSSGGQAK